MNFCNTNNKLNLSSIYQIIQIYTQQYFVFLYICTFLFCRLFQLVLNIIVRVNIVCFFSLLYTSFLQYKIVYTIAEFLDIKIYAQICFDFIFCLKISETILQFLYRYSKNRLEKKLLDIYNILFVSIFLVIIAIIVDLIYSSNQYLFCLYFCFLIRLYSVNYTIVCSSIKTKYIFDFADALFDCVIFNTKLYNILSKN